MTHEIEKDHREHSEGRVHALLKKHNHEDPDRLNPKRERFLALLRTRFGYTNDVAENELTRLLKQFYSMDRSVGVHHARPGLRRRQAEQPEN